VVCLQHSTNAEQSVTAAKHQTIARSQQFGLLGKSQMNLDWTGHTAVYSPLLLLTPGPPLRPPPPRCRQCSATSALKLSTAGGWLFNGIRKAPRLAKLSATRGNECEPQFLRSLRGDSQGKIRGDSQGKIRGDSQGKIRGDSQGKIRGDSQGKIRGDSQGKIRGDSHGKIRGDSQGDSQGKIRGDSQGKIRGDSHGKIRGDYQGKIRGDSQGKIRGDSQGKIRGDSHGKISGDFQGKIRGDSQGKIRGDSHGKIRGDSQGNIRGDFKGKIRGDFKCKIKGDSHGKIRDDSHGKIRGDSHGKIRDDSQCKIRGDSHGKMEGDTHGAILTVRSGAIFKVRSGAIFKVRSGAILKVRSGAILKVRSGGDFQGKIRGDSQGKIRGDSQGKIRGDSQGKIRGDFKVRSGAISQGKIRGDSQGKIRGDYQGKIRGDYHVRSGAILKVRSGAILTVRSGTILNVRSGRFSGKIRGDSKCKIRGDSHGKIRGDSKCKIRGDSHGKIRDDSQCKIRGDSQGKIRGDSQGKIRGDFQGKIRGDSQIEGDSHGKIRDDSHGKIRGDSHGKIRGDSQGKIRGDSQGKIRGDSQGKIRGDFQGKIRGDYQCKIRGDSQDQGKIRGDSKCKIRGDSHGKIRDDSQCKIRGDSQGKIRGDSKCKNRGDSQGKIRGDSKCKIKGDSHGKIRDDSHGKIRDDSQCKIRGDSHGKMEGDSHDPVNSGPKLKQFALSKLAVQHRTRQNVAELARAAQRRHAVNAEFLSKSLLLLLLLKMPRTEADSRLRIRWSNVEKFSQQRQAGACDAGQRKHRKMAHTMANSNKDNSGSNENVFKDLNMTPEEINRFTEAFKKEEFRKLFQEYVEELQNPEQRALYEKEIAQLEEERGMDVEFIHPTPGHVLKLKDASGKKVFINICTNDKIQVATMQRTEQNGKVGGNWSIPHSFAPPREDTDKSKQTCLVIDTVFHPDTYLMASRNAQFKKMIEDTAVQGAERNFQIKFANGGSAKRPKMTFKAQLETEPPNPFVQHYNNTQSGETPTAEGREFDLQDRAAEGDNESSPSTKNSPKQPKYEIKYSYQSDFGDFAYESPSDGSHTTALAGSSQSCPHSVQIVVELPGVTTAQAIDVDVDNRDLRVTSQQSSAAYNLQLRLPYPVTEDNGSAKFDRKSHRLTLILPCIAQQRPVELSVSSAVAMPDPAPLIEELPDSSETASSVDAKPTDATNTTENATDSSSTSMKEEFRVGQLLPSTAIRCSQTDSHLTMLIDVKNVDPESIKEAEVSSGGCCWAVSFASVGSGGWRSDYSLAVMRSDFTVDFVQ
uniref:Protein kintoun n=1 Tax=Macrostomum lignano TaxID=282301 RepID=A0A1I8HL16_9PLAT